MSISNDGPLRYEEYWWGECISGKKEQLQAMGIAAGLAFPGEAGGPKRTLSTVDPRGFPTKVQKADAGRFTADINFQGGNRPKAIATAYAQGVVKTGCIWSDNYTGTAVALVAAGLARIEHLPGQPGCLRKCVSTVFADGTVPSGAKTANHANSRLPGAKYITRISRLKYQVNVQISREEGECRRDAQILMDAAFRSKLNALPRPPRLAAPAGLCVDRSGSPELTEDQRASDIANVRSMLEQVPESRNEFLQAYVWNLREWMGHVWTDVGAGMDAHGYAIDADSLSAIKMSFDAVAEAVMQAQVVFNAAKHQRILDGYKAELARLDGSFQSHLFSLTRIAPTMREGAQS
jgi:hypothetical protein